MACQWYAPVATTLRSTSADIADEVARALCEKARSGVEVNVLLDAVGTAQMQPGLVRTIEEAGATTGRWPVALAGHRSAPTSGSVMAMRSAIRSVS